MCDVGGGVYGRFFFVKVDDGCWGGQARCKFVRCDTHMPCFSLMTGDIGAMRRRSRRHVSGVLSFIVLGLSALERT